MARRQPKRLVLCFVEGRADLIGTRHLHGRGQLGGGDAGLEGLRGPVVARLRAGAGVGHAQRFAGHRQRGVAALGAAVAAVKTTGLAFDQGGFARFGKFRRSGLDHNRAANAVAAHTDRRGAAVHLDAAHAGGVDVRQRRVHVIRAGRDQVHAVHLEAQAVIGQAVQRRQTRHPTGAIQAHSGHVAQQAGGVTGGGQFVCQIGGPNHVGALRLADVGSGCGDVNLGERGIRCVSGQRLTTQQGERRQCQCHGVGQFGRLEMRHISVTDWVQ